MGNRFLVNQAPWQLDGAPVDEDGADDPLAGDADGEDGGNGGLDGETFLVGANGWKGGLNWSGVGNGLGLFGIGKKISVDFGGVGNDGLDLFGIGKKTFIGWG